MRGGDHPYPGVQLEPGTLLEKTFIKNIFLLPI